MAQFGDGGDLDDGDVVEHAEGADHDAGDQNPSRVDRLGGHAEGLVARLGEPAQLGDAGHDGGQEGDHQHRGQRPQQRHRGGDGDAVGEVEGGEGDERGGDERDGDGVVARKERGEQEPP